MKKTGVLKLNHFHSDENPEEFYASTLTLHLKTRHKDISVPHKHDFYLAVLFTKGTGMHEIDFTSYKVKPGALFFLNPGQTHHWELSDDTDGYIFFHTQSFYDLEYSHNRVADFPFYYSMHSLPHVELDTEAFAAIEAMFRAVLQESRSAIPFQREALVSLVSLIYIRSARLYAGLTGEATAKPDSYYDQFRMFETLIEQHYRDEKSPSAYAGMLNVSAKHLNRIAQAAVGKTAGDVILDRVLLEAKKELVLQQRSFADVAYSLGYEDYAYFSRLFKKKTSETPSGFLKRYIG